MKLPETRAALQRLAADYGWGDVLHRKVLALLDRAVEEAIAEATAALCERAGIAPPGEAEHVCGPACFPNFGPPLREITQDEIEKLNEHYCAMKARNVGMTLGEFRRHVGRAR